MLALEYYEPCPPEDMSEAAASLIASLLVLKPAERLGGGEAGVSAVLHHAFFEPMELDSGIPLWERPSPFTPTLKHEADTSNFDVNDLARVHADRMRSQLEADVDEFGSEEEGGGGGEESGGGEKRGAAGEDHDDHDDSFKTVHATNLARMQLHTEAAEAEEAEEAAEAAEAAEEAAEAAAEAAEAAAAEAAEAAAP